MGRITVFIGIVSFAFCLFALSTFSQPLAQIDILSVSPRDIAVSAEDVFDEVASGLNAVGVGQKVYFQAEPEEGATVGGYRWEINARPSGSIADLSDTSGNLVTFRPDVIGVYTIRLTPLNELMQPTQAVEQELYAATWAGAGVFNTHEPPRPIAPNCGTGFCHGGSNANPKLNVSPEWIQSNHAQMLQDFMNGNVSSHYSVSCLPCHTVGFDDNPGAVNNGFDDVAYAIAFDLEQIPVLVYDAVTSGLENFTQLPAELQNLASIQCEICHGAGTLHPSHLLDEKHGIAGANMNPKACKQCHDAPTHHQHYYEWKGSKHSTLVESASTRESCLRCHSGEGFVDVQVNGLEPVELEHPNPIACAVCHDPHFSEHEHQLRVVGDYTLPSGDTFTGAGIGGLCMRCHNSRRSDAEQTALTNRHGVHHGPQADMLLGVMAVSFGLPFEPNSYHTAGVEDTCVACHMAEPSVSGVEEPPKVGSHTFSMRDDMGTSSTLDDELNVDNACGSCHEGLTSYDRTAWGDYDGDGTVDGIQTEVRGLFDILRPGILATMPGTSVEEESGTIGIGSADFDNLTPLQKKALYNYNYAWQDGSFGVHNTSYVVQMLQRSYFGIFLRPISDDYPLMDLRGPVQKFNWSFEPPPEDWSYRTAAPPPDIPAWSHASHVQASGPGAIGLNAPVGETTEYYGSWDNYSGNPDVPAVSWVDNSVWRAVFTMSTNKTDPNTVPSIRLRLALNHMKATSYIQVIPGDWLPVAERGVGTTNYKLYLRPPIADNGFFLAFDLMDFGEPFGVPCDGTVYLEEVVIDRFDLTDPRIDDNWTTVTAYSGSGLHSWTHTTAGVSYLSDVNGYSQRTDGLEQNTTLAQTRAFGAWSSPSDEVDLVTNQFYRAVWMLGCEDSTLAGANRLRIHTQDFRCSSYIVIDRDADPDASALPTSNGKDYYIYAEFPGTPTVDKLLLTWDLFDFDPNAGGWAKLTDVVVSRRDLP